MAKMTLASLKTFVKTYVDASKQAAEWQKTVNNMFGLIDKIGKIVSIDGDYNDKLPELDGDELPLGKTIEEYFVDLTLPADFDANGTEALTPSAPTVEAAAYSYTLGRKKIKTTQRYDDLERAALTSTDAADMVAKIMEKFRASASLYKFQLKKQLLGNLTKKVTPVTLAKPSDTQTSEAVIKAWKNAVEDASFANEGNAINTTALIGAAPSLVIYVKKGIMSTVEVDALAGAFHAEKLAVPADIKVVDDFGDADAKIWCIMIDPRGVKLHTGYHAVRSQENADGDFVNFFDHSEYTGFISKNTFVRVYSSAQ